MQEIESRQGEESAEETPVEEEMFVEDSLEQRLAFRQRADRDSNHGGSQEVLEMPRRLQEVLALSRRKLAVARHNHHHNNNNSRADARTPLPARNTSPKTFAKTPAKMSAKTRISPAALRPWEYDMAAQPLKTNEAVLLGLGVGNGDADTDVLGPDGKLPDGKSYQGQFAFVRATGQVAVADTDHMSRHKGVIRTPTSYEGTSKDFALCFSNSVLKPLLRLGSDEKGGEGEGGGRHLPRQHNLGFVQLLVDEIEARHHSCSHPSPSPNPTPNPNPNPTTNPPPNPLPLTLPLIPNRHGTNCSRPIELTAPSAPSCRCPSPASMHGCVRQPLAPTPTLTHIPPTPTPTPTPNQVRRRPRSCRPKQWRVPPPSISCRAAGWIPASHLGQRRGGAAASTLGDTEGRPRHQIRRVRQGADIGSVPGTIHAGTPISAGTSSTPKKA